MPRRTLGEWVCYSFDGLFRHARVFFELASANASSDTWSYDVDRASSSSASPGVFSGQGHTFTPVAVTIITAALLAWKQPLSGFAVGLSDLELRSAILLAILSFIIYPTGEQYRSGGGTGPAGLKRVAGSCSPQLIADAILQPQPCCCGIHCSWRFFRGRR